MRSGQLRKRIIIQQDTPTRDTHGGEVSSWGTLATRWASIEPLSGRESFTADRENAEITHRVRIRYDSSLSSVTPKMRVLFGSQVFDIESVLNRYERDRELWLMCREQI